MRQHIISIIGSVFCAGMLLLASCTKEDHYYKDYVIQRTYIGKPDSIWIQPGDQRVQIGMLTPKDAEARDLVIHWNNTDSVVLPIDHDAETQAVIIGGLEERSYVFNAYTIDRKGNRSLPMELSTTVYGDAYRGSIRDRNLSHSVVFPDSIALVWNAAQLETLFGVEIEFTDKDGEKQQVFSRASTLVSVFHDADADEPISVRSVYRPHVNAFEYFYTDPVEVDLAATKRSSLTFSSNGYLDAVYVDFKLVRTFLESEVPVPMAADIDMCYALGAGSRGNLFAMDGDGFGAFAANWQALINSWAVQNVGRLKLNRGAAALALYDELDETDRSQMVAAYEDSESVPSTRLSSLRVDDVIFLHSVDRDLYIAIKVTGTPPAENGALGNFVIDFKVSRP